MTQAEQAPQARVQTVIDARLDSVIAHLPEYPNKLRAIEAGIQGISADIRDMGLQPSDYVLGGIVGDVAPATFTAEAAMGGQFERQFADLADKLTLDPEGFTYAQMQREERNILIGYKHEGRFMTRYDVSARGTPESRDIIRNEMQAIGLATDNADEVWMTDGGMGALTRTFRALGNHIRRTEEREPVILSQSVCFRMATNAASDNGLRVQYAMTSDQPHQELSEEVIDRYLAQGQPVPDMMLLTPADNPTARSSDPHNLERVIRRAQGLNPGMVFVFDMAYMSMIPRDKAQAIMKVISDTGADRQAVFAVSESKHYASPGSRIGATVIKRQGLHLPDGTGPDGQPRTKSLGDIFQFDTIRNYPGFSAVNDVRFQALHRVIPPESFDRFAALLRQRQEALLEVLRDLDPNGLYFAGLDDVRVPGYGDGGDATETQDNPLYLYLRLRPGVSVLDVVARKLHIFGVPGSVFGDNDDHIRISLGVVSTDEILKRSPATQQRWIRRMTA